MAEKSSGELIRRARELGLGIPAFNVAHLPMTEAIIRAVRATREVGPEAQAPRPWSLRLARVRRAPRSP